MLVIGKKLSTVHKKRSINLPGSPDISMEPSAVELYQKSGN